MAVVKGIRERVHLPLYDAHRFEADDDPTIEDRTIGDQVGAGNRLRFFVDIQSKTKLETNQQESSVLSHYNTFEARALRIVVEPLLEKTVEGAGEEAVATWVVNDDFLREVLYGSVTSFIVGEKTMIQAPTWFFPSGAGPSNQDGSTNGMPSPEATFRFAEPVQISHQQNFRVEIEFPRGLNGVRDLKGRATVWAVLDGYITRDVQ